jgi:hypothetical protein
MLLKLQERGVQRPLVDGELVRADLLDPSGYRVSMERPHAWSVFRTMKSSVP